MIPKPLGAFSCVPGREQLRLYLDCDPHSSPGKEKINKHPEHLVCARSFTNSSSLEYHNNSIRKSVFFKDKEVESLSS